MKKVGIITWHYYPNFGSALQAFALQSVIEKLGYEARLINYRNPKFGSSSSMVLCVKAVLSQTLGRLPGKIGNRFRYSTIRFASKYHKQSKLVYDVDGIADSAGGYDTIVCGSDQIWAPNVFNPVYMASFANKNQRKVSYAASIGLNEIPENLIDEYRRCLSDFEMIGVREDAGRDLLKGCCGLDSQVVLDPTLLVDVDTYRKMERRVRGVKGPFMFCYFLKENNSYRNMVLDYAEMEGVGVVGVSAREDDGVWMQRLSDLGADEFLWLVDNARCVVTDSYHGSIFSLLFHKRFWCIERFRPDDPLCQNSRIRQLQKYFGIDNCVIVPNSTLRGDFAYDFDVFERRLTVLRRESMLFLKNALGRC